jgi:ATP-dependent protease ClpP protease subunit
MNKMLSSKTTAPVSFLGEDSSRIINTDTNEVYFVGPITMDSMSDLIKELKSCEKKALEACDTVKKTLTEKLTSIPATDKPFVKLPEPELIPLKLIINSSGGEVFAALFAIDEIKRLKITVHTYISGFCASAATLLSLVGKKRFISKHSYMLIHEVRGGCWGKKSDMMDSFENVNKLSELIIDYYVEHTKMTREELPTILQRDRYWDAKECIARGLVDEISS